MRTFIAAVVFMATANASYSEEKCDLFRNLYPELISDIYESYLAACDEYYTGDLDTC